ncbi:uncharacterized protein LOC103880555 [Papio anubis]|uniref:uncharacterized protein LOC103880555 n=1 Tax=Papio anubis TaxID=9555 RepID=UPI0012AD45D8|nr:uncharacterized protein LOC103880555 [Papio anubis]
MPKYRRWHHTSGCGRGGATLPGATPPEDASGCGALLAPRGVPLPSPTDLSALPSTHLATAANPGELGPLRLPVVVGVRGARLALANPGVQRARPPSFWANRDKPPDFPAVYAPRQTLTNTVRSVAFAPAHPLIDVSLDPIEGSSLFLVSQEDFCSLSPHGYLCRTHKSALPELRQLHFLLSLNPAKKVKGGERRECLTGSRRFQSACCAKSGQNSGAPRVLEVLSDPAAPSPAGSHVYQQLGEELRQPRAGAGTHLDQDLPDAPRSAGRTGRHFL